MNEVSDVISLPIRDASRRCGRRGLSIVEILVVLAILGLIIVLFMPATRTARPAAYRTQCRNQLKMIALALHNYADKWESFPPAYTVDEEGRPLHSWRTLILPYMERQALYETIDLSKPWDDPANREAYETVISNFRCPASDIPKTDTTYLAVITPGGPLHPEEPGTPAQFDPNSANRLMVIEVDLEYAVHWMQPIDVDEKWVLNFGPESKLAHAGVVSAVFVDGTGRSLSAKASAEDRQQWISNSVERD